MNRRRRIDLRTTRRKPSAAAFKILKELDEAVETLRKGVSPRDRRRWTEAREA